MKAVRIHEHGGPEVLCWEKISAPKMDRNEVLVEIKAAAMNHLDIWVREGLPRVPLPVIMGSDGSGVIVETGSDTEGWQIGDEVMIQPGTYCGTCNWCLSGQENYCANYGILGETEDGTQCEFLAIQPGNLIRKPSTITFDDAAAFSLVFLTAHAMLIRRAHLQAGETVLVLGGASGVGTAAIQIAKLFNCIVIAVAGNEKKLELCRELGADHLISYREEKIYQRVKKITGGLGVDIVVEHVGSATWLDSLRSLALGGRLVTCGATTGAQVEIDLRHLFRKQQSILGSTMGDLQSFREVVSWLAEGKVRPVVDRIFPMREIRQAHRYLETGQQSGKVVLNP
ncbi:MAG: zinc-binding dehydrogenase [Fidelibacterota bacterium]